MDLKEIAGKAVMGEDISSTIKDFTPEQTVELNNLIISEQRTAIENAKTERQKELEAVEALRKEKARVTTKTTEGHQEVVNQVKLDLKKEALQEARKQFLSSRKLTPEKEAEIDAIAQTIDLQTVAVSQVYPRAYAAANADQLIQAEESQRQAIENAQNFNASGAGASGTSSGGSAQQKVIPPAVARILRENQNRSGRIHPIPLTPEEVEKGMNAGNGWRELKTF